MGCLFREACAFLALVIITHSRGLLDILGVTVYCARGSGKRVFLLCQNIKGKHFKLVLIL